MILDPKQFQDLAASSINDLLAGLSADGRAAIEGPAQAILVRASELGTRAAAGDTLARDTLQDLWAQSLMLAGSVASTAEDRILNTLHVLVIGAVRILVAALAVA